MWFDRGRISFLAYIFSEKAKHFEKCLSFGGSMPQAQIKQFPLTQTPLFRGNKYKLFNPSQNGPKACGGVWFKSKNVGT